MEKNEEFIGEVIGIGANGEGVIKNGAFIVFVPFSITGEIIKYKVIKISSKGNFGKLLEVIKPSIYRTEPKCPVFYKCGGCQLQHIRYDYQLEIKKNNIKNCFSKIANIDFEISDAVCGTNQYKYRNKLQLPIQFDGEKNIFGFYSENSHRVNDIDNCDINPCWTKDIISFFKIFMKRFNLLGYNEVNFSGDIREVTVKEIGNSLIITVVGLKKSLKNANELVLFLKENLKYEFSLYYNFNNSTSNVIYSDNFNLLYGNENYKSELNGIKYSIGVRSFSQVNTEVCSLLYNFVVDNILIDSDTTIFDLYSGAGLMTAMLAKCAKKVIGIEIIKEAVLIADELMIDNNLQNKVINYCGKCEELLPDLIKKERANNNKISVVLDPPRKGCDKKVLDAIIKSNVDRIVYVSCMPSTLSRDVGILTGTLIEKDGNIIRSNTDKLRYNIKRIVPFEMFPQTKHIETVCVLEKNS